LRAERAMSASRYTYCRSSHVPSCRSYMRPDVPVVEYNRHPGAGHDHRSAATPHAFLHSHQACAAGDVLRQDRMFSSSLPRFAGICRASFALCVRSNRLCSHVGRSMFSRTYSYVVFWRRGTTMKLLALVLLLCSAWFMTASVAGADCGWVLWSHRVEPHGEEWTPINEFTTAHDCLLAQVDKNAQLVANQKSGRFECYKANIDPRRSP
jgi:hypothetical protein